MMRGLVCAVVVAALTVSAVGMAGAQQFSDVGTQLGIPGSVGAAWGDANGDGYADLFLSSNAVIGHASLLLQNDGDRTFTDVSSAVGFPEDQREGDGVAWGDYDNDGDLDVFVGYGDGYEELYRNDGDAFVEVGFTAGFTRFEPARTVAWCDYDRDGWLDILICYRLSQACRLYRNLGDGTFVDATGAAGLTAATSTRSVAWADYDGDGLQDVVLVRGWPATDFATQLYRNNGDGTFTETGVPAGMSEALDGIGVAWADFDNDKWLDCYITSGPDSPRTRDWLFRNNGDGTFVDVSETAGMAGDIWATGSGIAWADYDNDGYVDLYVGHLDTGNQPYLYHNNGDGTLSEVAQVTGVDGSRPNEAACWADFDLDGKQDLFVAVGGAGLLSIPQHRQCGQLPARPSADGPRR